jgi:hypothetical protein
VNVKTAWSKFKQWFWTQNAINESKMALKNGQRGKFVCPRCGAVDFVFVTNPTFSVNRVSEARTKAMVKCDGPRTCIMRYVFVSKDFGITWEVYAPSN